MAIEQYQKIYLYKRIVHAKLFINNHFGEDIDLNNIADEAYFSKFHFIRTFKNVYGKAPHYYLTEVRINAAKELLTKNISITEVCFQVGFGSTTSFAGLFKKSVGLSPSAFQQQQQKRKTAIASSPPAFYSKLFCRNAWMDEK
jgi:AraC-like DNA-binding protein